MVFFINIFKTHIGFHKVSRLNANRLKAFHLKVEMVYSLSLLLINKDIISKSYKLLLLIGLNTC